MISDYAQYLPLLTGVLYLGAFVLWLPWLLGRGGAAGLPLRSLAWALLISAFVLHSGILLFIGCTEGRCPVGSAMELLQFVAWSLMSTYFIVAALFRSTLPAFFTSALAGLLCLVSSGAGDLPYRESLSSTVTAHAGLSLFAYGAFALIALTSLMYLVQHFGIRRRRWTNIFRALPSLRELELVNLRLLQVGLFVYVLALLVGAWWYLGGQGSVSGLKFLFATLVLVAYALVLFFRMAGKLFGRRLALAGILLFILALLALYPVQHSGMGPVKAAPAEEVAR